MYKVELRAGTRIQVTQRPVFDGAHSKLHRAGILLCALVLGGVLITGGLLAPLPAQSATPYLQKIRTVHSKADFARRTGASVALIRKATIKTWNGDLLIGSAKGIVRKTPDNYLSPFPAERLLPCNEVTVIVEETPNLFWIGTTRGAIRYDRRSARPTLEYFAGRRWLPDDRVAAIGFEGPSAARAVWIETPQGFSRIEYRAMTLGEKARLFEERVRARHVRHGLTASSHLRAAGDLSSNQPVSSDNDGLWTAMYLVGECYRYKVTGDPAARAYARQAIQALMRLESITGIPGFPARSFIKVGAEERPKDGKWRATPDGAWEWKGDTSSDEIVGHYLAYAVYYDLLADGAEKSAIRAVVERITTHILDHGYHLVDVDGRPTRWGWWAPEEIWADPDELGLRALHMLSHLRVAHHITGNPKYQAAYGELVTKHRYALLTRNQKINIPGRVNHSDDELAFLSYYPLLQYETDPALRKIYGESLERSWRVERPERNPLWNFIYAVGAGHREFDAAESVRTLQEVPMDLISWHVTNSHRLDLPIDPMLDRFRQPQSLRVLPPDERPMLKWNGNPYALDGGNGGQSEDDGAFFLLPYWMGRYHKLIAE